MAIPKPGEFPESNSDIPSGFYPDKAEPMLNQPENKSLLTLGASSNNADITKQAGQKTETGSSLNPGALYGSLGISTMPSIVQASQQTLFNKNIMEVDRAKAGNAFKTLISSNSGQTESPYGNAPKPNQANSAMSGALSAAPLAYELYKSGKTPPVDTKNYAGYPEGTQNINLPPKMQGPVNAPATPPPTLAQAPTGAMAGMSGGAPSATAAPMMANSGGSFSAALAAM